MGIALKRPNIRRDKLNLAFKECVKKGVVTNQVQFGKLIEVKKSQISSMLSGNPQSSGLAMPISDKTAEKIELALGKPLGWLDIPSNSIKHSVESNFDFVVPIKVLPKCVVSEYEYLKSGELVDMGYEATELDCSNSSFSLIQEGDAMEGVGDYSVPAGSVLIIDPEITPFIDCLVFAKLLDKKVYTIRRYSTDAGQTYLAPTNKLYSAIEMNDSIEIIGVVLETNKRKSLVK